MNITTRNQAKLAGEKFYFTGNACSNNHISKRRTVTGVCIECAKEERNRNHKNQLKTFRAKHGSEYAREKSAKHYEDNKEKCKERSVAWQKANPEKVRAARLKWNAVHRDEMAAYLKEWWCNNPHKATEYATKDYTIKARAAWNKRNKGLKNHYTRLRQRAIKQATPAWADLDKIKRIYVLCEYITESTGVAHHVDHIVPVLGKHVRGLHVDYNLQIIPAKANLSKGNKHHS